MATAKKMDVPDIGGLLGQIAEKRNDLPKAPIQSVQPVEENLSEKQIVEKKPSEDINAKPAKQNKENKTEERTRGVGGRPSIKDKDKTKYVKISPRILKELKKDAERTLIDELFQDDEGNIIKTMDELVALALVRLLPPKKDKK